MRTLSGPTADRPLLGHPTRKADIRALPPGFGIGQSGHFPAVAGARIKG